jgi:predicted nucleic acid-binding protein
LKLVIDASVAVAAAANPLGFERFRRFELVAPPLPWIEAISTLHAMVWRGELRGEQAPPVRDRVLSVPVKRLEPESHALEAWSVADWSVADELGWAKTYDANYVALARMMDCRLVTLDARMRRGTGRFGFVIGPTELE